MSANQYKQKSRKLHSRTARLFATTSVTSSLAIAIAALGVLASASVISSARAQIAGMQPGEAYATRFSGALDANTIDVNGIVGSIVDIRNPGFAANGAHWVNEPQRYRLTAGEVGQVFGIALDDASPPNIYITATSAFGLHVNAGGAGWMPGMWGPDGGPGTIYKLNALNNYQPEIFANIMLGGRENSGAALGNIAFDRQNGQFFVSDMETGMVHRISAADGRELGRYDHGLEGRVSFFDAMSGAMASLGAVGFDPASSARINDCPTGDFSKTVACWNVADFRRRIWGLGVHSGRLYYALWGSQGFDNPEWEAAGDDQNNTIWSIGIGGGGALNRGDIRREFTIPGFFVKPGDFQRAGGSHPVSDIAFSAKGVMLLSERGGMRNLGLGAENAFAWPNESRLMRFERDPGGMWQPVGRYDIGFYERQNNGQPFMRASSSGGVDFGFAYNGSNGVGGINLARRDEFIWSSGDMLCSPGGPCFNPATGAYDDASEVHGLQGQAAEPPLELTPLAAYQPYPDPGPATPATAPLNSYLIDLDENMDAGGNVISQSLQSRDASHSGDVEIYKPVSWGYTPPGGAIHLPVGSFHVPARSPHRPRGSIHLPRGSFHLLPRSPHRPIGSVHRPRGSFHLLPKSPHRPRGSVHRPKGSFHLLPKSPHRPRGSVHRPKGSFHLLPKSPHRPKGSVHRPKGSFHLLPKSPHRPKGSVHRPKGSLHLLPRSPHRPKGSVHRPKGSLHLLPRSPHRPKGSVHRPKGSLHLLPQSPHRPIGSVHRPKGSLHLLPRSPHRPIGSVHRPKGSFVRPVHKPAGSIKIPVHRPKNSLNIPLRPIHKPVVSRSVHKPARPATRPVHNVVVSRAAAVKRPVTKPPVLRAKPRIKPAVKKIVPKVVTPGGVSKSTGNPKILLIKPKP